MQGVRVLVVEDESPIAMLLEDMLETLGCVVSGCAASVAEALRLGADGEFDVALLDMNLAGEVVLPVAHVLEAREAAFVFVTGYGEQGVPDRFRGRPVVSKPFLINELAASISLALEARPARG